MYNGTNRTAQKSQENIVRALVGLLKNEPYSSISISAICKEAGVSRQTFYSLFESKENIILYELSKKHCFHPGSSCEKNRVTLKDICDEYAAYIIDKEEILGKAAEIQARQKKEFLEHQEKARESGKGRQDDTGRSGSAETGTAGTDGQCRCTGCATG